MKHYKTTDQITEQIDYEFKLPKYGKSTTDPTYYEPAATRIANMRRSAQSGKSLYDFEYEKGKKFSPEELLKMHDDIRITPGRKPGMTQEEISQQYTETLNDVEDMASKKKAQLEANKRDIEHVKDTMNALKNSDGTDTKSE